MVLDITKAINLSAILRSNQNSCPENDFLIHLHWIKFF